MLLLRIFRFVFYSVAPIIYLNLQEKEKLPAKILQMNMHYLQICFRNDVEIVETN